MSKRKIYEPPADWRQRHTVTIPEYADIIGIGKNTAYLAAREGEIVTIKIRDRVLVPVPWIIKQLEAA